MGKTFLQQQPCLFRDEAINEQFEKQGLLIKFQGNKTLQIRK
jgi:hypothetical protein